MGPYKYQGFTFFCVLQTLTPVMKPRTLRTLACLFVCALTGCEPPLNDAEMLQNFNEHRQEFEALRAMITHDKGLSRVDDQTTSPADPSTIGITPARIAEYRSLLQKLGIRHGLYVSAGKGFLRIELHANVIGGYVRYSTKSYAWLSEDPSPWPVVPDIDAFVQKQSEEREKANRDLRDHKPTSWQQEHFAYRHIDGHWYLYYEN